MFADLMAAVYSGSRAILQPSETIGTAEAFGGSPSRQ
jgi:hypothetical protein